MGCCKVQAFEFSLLWLIIASASVATSTVYDLRTFTVQGGTVQQLHPEYTDDAQFEGFFLGYSIGVSFMGALLVWLIQLVLFCCGSCNDWCACGGRKTFMLRLLQCVKLVALVATLVLITRMEAMAFKQHEELTVGCMLLGCEVFSVLVELVLPREAMLQASRRGMFVQKFTTLTVSAMVTLQIVYVNQLRLLYAAIAFSTAYAGYIAWLGHKPDVFENWTPLLGLASGVVLAVLFEGTSHFKRMDEIVAYAVLFGFNFILPMVKCQYEREHIGRDDEPSYFAAV